MKTARVARAAGGKRSVGNKYSGTFNTRIPPELHRRLVALAKADGNRSLNSVVMAACEAWAAMAIDRGQ